MDVTLDVIFACKFFSDVILHVISDMHGERARAARILWYSISAESRILALHDHRCCNVRPLSTVYGHPYCPHGSRGPI